MISSLPTWWVEYERRRPTLRSPLTSEDRGKIEVGALDREGAAAAFRQRFAGKIVAIYPESGTGFS